MKTLLFLLLLLVAPAAAQVYDSRDSNDNWLRGQQQENDRRRLDEIQRQQRAEEQRRLEIQRYRNDPIISERQRRQCLPGQIIC